MTSSSDPSLQKEASNSGFTSTLKEGPQRFLAHALDHSFVCGRRTAEDFIRHFPPSAIMKGLENQASLRASILVLTTGIKQKIALKKEWADAAADLQIALDERETDAESIIDLFGSDDRVRYLEPQKLWAFLTEGEFWKSAAAPVKGQPDVARDHLAFLLERALEDKLLTHRDVVDGATVEELANRLPKVELGRLIQCALKNADKGSPFTEADLLGTTPPKTLVQHVPLAHLWEAVVVPKIAVRHGYVAATKAPIVMPNLPAPPAAVSAGVANAGKEATSLKPVTPVSRDKDKDKDKEAASTANKDAARVKAKPPALEAVPKPPPLDPADLGPGLARPALDLFGDDDAGDDVEMLEDEVQAV